ncbi:putative baseplate assembly protein [Streptomyces sp. NBC_00237]|uniref:putative baseplate assembly protein n=1 Tax=Streptomyces sp. NBC_00237 TaxID=2975687 RepID=UPI002256411C|nr:putative baseplate assembly protein [Streptomyces sp. NBC_00237]MCX5205369.1 putative baseplate assembly protein [Streptomyces sp. NBC_00237]
MIRPLGRGGGRRADVRAAGLNGLDYVEVGTDQRTLTVFFLGRAPDPISENNVRIAHSPHSVPVHVDGITVHRSELPDLDDHMEVRVTSPGDWATYTLRLVATDEQDRPTDRPLPGFDLRFASLEFTFKASCPSELDCAAHPFTPPPASTGPEIDYLAKDYASFRRLILDRLSLVMPDWQERHVPDVGIVLAEILAYVGDHLSYFQDAVATEAYLDTARQRVSVRRHAKLVDYALHEGCNARVFVCLHTEVDRSLNPRHLQFLALRDPEPSIPDLLAPQDVQRLPVGGYEVFEPMGSGPVDVRVAHNEIPLYTWGDEDCRLPEGATGATLLDAWAVDGSYVAPDATRERRLALRVGDVLVFEEVKGPHSGDPADADRAHRHAVRLTAVDASVVDVLYDRPVVEVAWAAEDALPFPLCLSALGRPPTCALVEGIVVARGNVVTADHGRTVHREALGTVAAEEEEARCEGVGRIAESAVRARPFTPSLRSLPLTFRQEPSSYAPAARLAVQDPRGAGPQVSLVQRGDGAPPGGWRWTPRPDLLDSGPLDRHFVVETDNAGRARLRFGDDHDGRRPEAGTRFVAGYRIGNGPSGNVGAESISRLLLRDGRAEDPLVRPRNPLPASGGTAAEPLDEAKSRAPTAFRSRLRRAVTADDYAALAALEDDTGRSSQVQRAAASLRWTGSWYEVLTTVDPMGRVEADEELLRLVARRLRPFRRIGHDLVVAPAVYVPVYLELSVCVRPGFLSGHVRADLLDAFSNRVLPGGRRGFFHPDSLTFGQGVSVSRLTSVAQGVSGVESAEVSRLEVQSDGPNGAIEDGVLRMGPCEVARLDNDPNAPDRGRLVLRLGGGR